MTHKSGQNNMVQNAAAQNVTHNDSQLKSKKIRGGGVGPAAMGRRKRTGREQFFFIV
jgi:hypothetical protein